MLSFFFSLYLSLNSLIGLQGQSNALGQAFYTTIQDDLINGVPNARIFNGTSYVPLDLTNNFGGTGSANNFGIEMRLMQKLCDYYGGQQYLAKYAVGGTALYPSGGQWYPGGAIYTPAMAYTQAAKAAINKNLRCMVWIQGEADAGSIINASAYQQALTDFITAQRAALGQPNLPYIIVSLSNQQSSTTYPYISTVVAAQQAVANSMQNVYFISQNNVTGDGSHYGAAGYEDIAIKVFNVIITLPSADNIDYEYVRCAA